MTGEVIPFPRERNRPWIARHARRMPEMSHEAAERHLRRHLHTMAETLRGMDIPAELVANQVYSTECAIRAALWRSEMTPGGTAWPSAESGSGLKRPSSSIALAYADRPPRRCSQIMLGGRWLPSRTNTWRMAVHKTAPWSAPMSTSRLLMSRARRSHQRSGSLRCSGSSVLPSGSGERQFKRFATAASPRALPGLPG